MYMLQNLVKFLKVCTIIISNMLSSGQISVETPNDYMATKFVPNCAINFSKKTTDIE